MNLKVKYLFPNIPELVSRDGDSGYDIRAAIDIPLNILPNERASVPTGIMVEIDTPPVFVAVLGGEETQYIPLQYELQVRPRSGLTKRGLIAQFGTIDASYRGEIWITIINVSREVMTIEPLERIAQLVVCPIFKPTIVKADRLTPTERGARGFGSTGKD